ncbi:MAG: hypothetical protein A2X94_14085 [Bdellovibrionales bacterium GWB1_55_8]|nr:MAG: hypothetical protein A2X94_14085 [Bdellovibrionales bacterium GWB1_55_8]
MELFDVLKKDHDQVKVLCRRIQTAGGESGAGKRLFQELTSMLEVHMQAEEHLYYARLEDNKETLKFAIEGYEEHRLAKMLLDELKSKNLNGEHWNIKFKVFSDVVLHHIEEEEDEFFESSRDIFEEDELEELGSIFSEQKQQLLTPASSRTTRRSSIKPRRAVKAKARGRKKSVRARRKAA